MIINILMTFSNGIFQKKILYVSRISTFFFNLISPLHYFTEILRKISTLTFIFNVFRTLWTSDGCWNNVLSFNLNLSRKARRLFWRRFNVFWTLKRQTDRQRTVEIKCSYPISYWTFMWLGILPHCKERLQRITRAIVFRLYDWKRFFIYI